MTVAYISGSYRSKIKVWGIRHLIVGWHIWKARQVGIRYWKKGYACIVPHLNTAFFDHHCADHVWLQGDIEIIKRLDRKRDVIIMMKGWEDSEGARAEHLAAVSCGLRVIFDKE